LILYARQAAYLMERVWSEEMLRQRTVQFETLLNEAPLGVYLIDGDFRIRQVNPTALPVFGPIPGLIGRDFDEVIHMLWPKAYADEVVRLFRHTLETGEPYVTHERIEERRDREVTEYYEWQIHRIPLPEDRYGVVCYFRDISAEVQAREAISESEERFRTLADHMSQFAWMADATGWIFWYNRRWYVYTGTTLEEMQGWGWEKVHHPDHLNGVVKKWRRAHETEESWEDTFPLRGADGRYRWFLSRAMPIRDETGHIVRWFGTNTDVTDQRAAEEEVRRLLDDARAHEGELREKQEQLMPAAKLASIGQLATGVAHEINNPLNNIGLFVGNVLDAMKRGELVPEKAIRHLDAALEQTKKATTIIEHLRMFGRRATTSFEPVRMEHVIRSAVALMEAPFRHGGVELVMELSPDDPPVMGNAIQLEQVLLNLLTNARDAVEGTPQKSVRVASTVKGSHVEVLVSDTGIGIPAELQSRVFDPFFTTKDVGKGTGLGLSISYGNTMDHGGAISVDSEPNEGTTFTITLPLAGK
jgi:PAS domain S-box-containing protein